MEKSLLEARQYSIAMDIFSLASLLSSFLQSCDPKIWKQRGSHVGTDEWTLHQTVAHLTSTSEYYLSALQHALQQEPLVVPGFQRRRDLVDHNEREILHRQHFQPSELIGALHQALADTAIIAQQLTSEQFSLPVTVPVFNRPLTILELLEMQVVHPGIVHAAQVVLPAGRDMLWKCYESDYMHRMLERFFCLMTLIYWPERGGHLHTTLQFLVSGTAGGAWSINIAPIGSRCSKGKAPKPQVTIWASNADALCQFFTNQITLPQALFSRKFFVWGNLFLATKLPYLFSPT